MKIRLLPLLFAFSGGVDLEDLSQAQAPDSICIGESYGGGYSPGNDHELKSWHFPDFTLPCEAVQGQTLALRYTMRPALMIEDKPDQFVRQDLRSFFGLSMDSDLFDLFVYNNHTGLQGRCKNYTDIEWQIQTIHSGHYSARFCPLEFEELKCGYEYLYRHSSDSLSEAFKSVVALIWVREGVVCPPETNVTLRAAIGWDSRVPQQIPPACLSGPELACWSAGTSVQGFPGDPTSAPTGIPVMSPTTQAPITAAPVSQPTLAPTKAPILTSSPVGAPSSTPTATPTGSPTRQPTGLPTGQPSGTPVTATPVISPTSTPTFLPTIFPSSLEPTEAPIAGQPIASPNPAESAPVVEDIPSTDTTLPPSKTAEMEQNTETDADDERTIDAEEDEVRFSRLKSTPPTVWIAFGMSASAMVLMAVTVFWLRGGK